MYSRDTEINPALRKSVIRTISNITKKHKYYANKISFQLLWKTELGKITPRLERLKMSQKGTFHCGKVARQSSRNRGLGRTKAQNRTFFRFYWPKKCIKVNLYLCKTDKSDKKLKLSLNVLLEFALFLKYAHRSAKCST